jgi:hypothetical protein
MRAKDRRGSALRASQVIALDPAPRLQQEFERAHRVANGNLSAADIDWLGKGFSAFLANGGSVSLERCLRLPWKDGGVHRACRDYWLRRAWGLTDSALTPWRRSEALAAAIRAFASKQWTQWRGLSDVPPEAAELETALFHAFSASERMPLTAMQIHNIARCRQHS